MKMKTALSATFGLLALSAAVMASAADMPVIKPMRGTVDSVENNTLNFTTRAGAHQSIGLTDKTGVEDRCRVNQVRQLHRLCRHTSG